MKKFPYLAAFQLIMIFFWTFHSELLLAQPDQIKRIQASSIKGMKDAAERTARMLETSIQMVIRYAQESKNADLLIEDTILPNFNSSAIIETANKVKNDTILTKHRCRAYFTILYNKAKTVPDLRVYFPKVEVTIIDRYNYRCEVKYTQMWDSERYTDLTDKIVNITFVENGNKFVAIITGIKYVPHSLKIIRR
jgi:hypothetical protein